MIDGFVKKLRDVVNNIRHHERVIGELCIKHARMPRKDFLKAWPAESTARRVEYADHKNVLDDFRRRAAGGNSGS